MAKVCHADRIRVGLIGCGSIAIAHLNGYRQCRELAQVVALCDTDASRAENVCKQFELDAKYYSDYHSMLEENDIDAVDVCLPIMAHEEVAVAAAECGKHIIVEKPLANTLAQAKRIVAAAEAAGVTLMVAHNQRFRPMHVKMKELLDAGKIGDIVSARAEINQNIQAILPDGHWHYYHRGALISIGVHMLDLLRYFVGDVRRVSGFWATAMMPMVGQQGVVGEEADDLAVAALEFENGALGTLAASYCSKAQWPSAAVFLHGTRGAMHTLGGLHLMSERDEAFKTLRKIQVQAEPVSDWRFDISYVREIRHFLECLRDGAEPMCSGRDNLFTMAAIEGIYQSGATGKTVEVERLLQSSNGS